MAYRLTPYAGAEASSEPRFALEYGPILMALTGEVDEQGNARLSYQAPDLIKHLKPMPGQPLHFSIDGDTHHQYLPYWQVGEQTFTCYPVITPAGARTVESVGLDDLALASRGGVATSDSELAREPGNTAKAIDGIISTPEDFSNRWHSSTDTPHPHWIQVKLPRAAVIGRVVIRFADPQGHPSSFLGIVRVAGKDVRVFDIKDYMNRRHFGARISPVLTDTFRLVIRESANPAYPNAAQVSEIEIYPPAR